MLFNTWTFVGKQFDIVTYKFYASLVLQSAFHLSKFTGQPILIINVMHKAKDMVFQQNLLEKACFIAKMSWCSHGLPGQFWRLESAFSQGCPPPSPTDIFWTFLFFFLFLEKLQMPHSQAR